MVVGESTTEIDVLVIGAGPGGYVAAIRAAQLGKSVTLVEKAELGGVCLNRGCIPSKALISAAQRYENMLNSAHLGLTVEQASVDMGKVQAWKNDILSKQTGGVSSLLKGNKVEVVQGEAFFTGEDVVRVVSGYESSNYKFNHCIVATGSRPAEIEGFPFGGRILSSTEALNLTEVPKSLVVIGGGYIGVELGQTYAKFGSQVTIIEGAEQLLPQFEKELTRFLNRGLKKAGVQVVTKAKAIAAKQTEDSVTVTYEVGGKEESIEADYVLVTVGRKPNTDELGLDVIKMDVDEHGLIRVNEQGLTNIPNVYAIGDIVAGPMLAHKASYEGKVAAEAIAGMPSVVDYKCIPSVVFSDPEIASVGLSESEAKENGIEVKTGKFNYAANGRAQTMDAAEGFVKLVADAADYDRVIGAQICGPEASNLIAELGLAIEMGATLEDLSLTIHAHPTLAEIVMEAADVALGKPIHQLVR